jgi:hypothetical protein
VADEDSPYGWQKQYLAALSEKDEKRLPACVVKAREHIVRRRVQLHGDTADDKEIQALEIALKTLRVLYSNWI